MGAVNTKTFKNGNSVAVRLPKELGFDADVDVTIEREGESLRIKPVRDLSEEKRKLNDLVERINAIWGDTPRPRSNYAEERMEFPDRPGLY